jgi:sugar lactone lactonase YvrE
MTRHLLAFSLLCTLTFTAAQIAPDRDAYELPGNDTYPEGIAYAEDIGAFFVSGAGSGAIYRVDIATGEATTLLEPGRAEFTTIGLAVDGDTLWVAGGMAGELLRFDDIGAETFEPGTGPSASFMGPYAEATFLNDVVVGPDGTVYVTDSRQPVLFHLPPGENEFVPFVEFLDTPFEYTEGFNANGIVMGEDGSTLLVIQANTGRLFRIDVETEEVTEVDLGGTTLPGGDGLVLDGQTLYVVQNGPDQISVVNLGDDLSTGTVERTITDERLASSATAALVGDQLLVTNAQFAAMQTGPELPFEVLVLPVE